jgi:hypothetical protein
MLGFNSIKASSLFKRNEKKFNSIIIYLNVKDFYEAD